MRKMLIAMAFMAAGSVSASAATLSTATGDVLVNTGQGFKRATPGQALKAGDRVMIGQGGGDATVTYDMACFEKVAAATVVTVQAGIPCNVPGAQTTAAPFGNVPTTALIVGGAAAIGGAALLISQANKSSSP